MIKLRTIIIIFVLYLVAYLSIRFDFNLLKPYDYVKDLFLQPVKAITDNVDVNLSDESYESIIKSMKQDIEKLQKLNDITLTLSDYDRINATIIERNKEYWFNTITINKGKSDGIKNDAAVIVADGLIGKTVNVREYSSDVKLLTTNDSKSKISVVVHNENKDYYGIMSGYDSKKNLLKVILFEEGDILDNMKVETTGLGGVFPSGLIIGEVFDTYKEDDDVTFVVRVRPSAKLEGDKYVSILQKKEGNNT